ncbi:PREDICTED: pentatricopeptide repeat-containing protein At1g07590, mitochondrial-like [Fragaria vesca subsp. vesca]
MGDGFPIHRGDIFHAINRLRKLKSNQRALEVMEWVIRERPYMPKELDYSYLLEFTTKFHGISQGAIRLPLECMKRMRELGHPISHLVFNRLIILHSSSRRKKLIPKILAQMKADKVARHASTFNILMKMEASEHNVDGLMKVYSDMKRENVEPNEISYCIIATAYAVARLHTAAEAYVEALENSATGKNWSTLDVLIMLYGYLGKEKQLEKTWGLVKQLPRVRSKSYVMAIEAFGRIGQLTLAEELWLEMKSVKGLRSTEQFNSIISVYCKHGLIDKATGIFREITTNSCKPNAITFRHLALGCLKAGLVEEATKTLDLGMDLTMSNVVRNSTPWLETTLLIIEAFVEKGDIRNVEKLFEELAKAKYIRYTFVYNTLIKAYVKAKIYDPNLLKRMILGGARPDAETYSLMKLAEQFQT